MVDEHGWTWSETATILISDRSFFQKVPTIPKDIDSFSRSPGCKCGFNAQLGNKGSQGCSFFLWNSKCTNCAQNANDKWCPLQQLQIANWLPYQRSEVQHQSVPHWAPLWPSDLVVRDINTLRLWSRFRPKHLSGGKGDRRTDNAWAATLVSWWTPN